MKSVPLATAVLATLLPLAVPVPLTAARAKARPIVMDGLFSDWQGLRPAKSDPAGDGAADAVDLGRLWLASDAEALYLRIQLGRETLLQNPPALAIGNQLRLYLDLDNKAGTGLPTEGLGVDLEIRFGGRQVISYDESGEATSRPPGSSGVTMLPTHSSDEFEIRVPLPAVATSSGGETSLVRKLRLLFREEVTGGDRLPQQGSLKVKTAKKAVPDPEVIELERGDGESLRVLTMNVEDSSIVTRQSIYRRYLEALRPDVINFQELLAWDAETTRDFVESVLPLPGGRRWEAAAAADCVTVSSYPILDSAPIDGNLVAHLDLPDLETSRDLVVFNVHLPCCDNDSGRDGEIDRLMATWRDLLAGSGPFPIGPEDAMVFVGDLNLVGFRRQFEAIRDGVFIGSGQGADFSPAREAGSLEVAFGRHTHRRTAHTWRRFGSVFVPGKLDFFFFTDDVATLRKSFVVDTETMKRKYRRRYGLRTKDSLNASDHLAGVADLEIDP